MKKQNKQVLKEMTKKNELMNKYQNIQIKHEIKVIN